LALVSVILPVFNAENYLKTAIDSILNQSYPHFELIIINDGSTDGSEQIIRSYKDQRIMYYYQQNAGVAAALNKGISGAKGKYIWRHDADDISLPGRLQLQVEFLESHPEFVLCAMQIAFMTAAGKIAYNYRQPKNIYFQNKEFVEVNRADFDPYSPITHATVLINRQIINEFNGYREFFKTSEDVDLWLRILLRYKMAVLNNCNYFVRLSRNSATQIQGWKNEFFRNLAFKYYEQRVNGSEDDLQRCIYPEIPYENFENKSIKEKGKLFRSDLLLFLYPLHLNAKDWKGSWELVRQAMKDGWKSSATWKAIFLPILGKKIVNVGVRLKSFLKK
jgi:glycosyltransferase involved in cell wall biosynthesis